MQTNPQQRVIIHVDMDAFFAAIEQRDFPQLRGKPVVVGGSPHSRGVVSTASYEARKFGIHSAMPTARVPALCPQAIFVKARFSAYKEASEQIHDVFARYTEQIEPLSLDEAFLDVSQRTNSFLEGARLAQQILADIRTETALSASAGVAHNKFIAKVASDYKKPGGLTVVQPDEAQAFIDKLPIKKFFGVGKVTEEKMLKLGIYSGHDLRQWPLAELERKFGKAGSYYFNISRGIDNRPVKAHRERKSLGTERTFRRDIYTWEQYEAALEAIVDELINRLDKKMVRGRTLTLKTKDFQFNVHTRQRTLSQALSSRPAILQLARELLHEVLPKPIPLRLMGITLSHLDTEDKEKNTATTQLSLWQD
jgi:DNA polymerase-4